MELVFRVYESLRVTLARTVATPLVNRPVGGRYGLLCYEWAAKLTPRSWSRGVSACWAIDGGRHDIL